MCLRHGFGIFSPANRNFSYCLPVPKTPLLKGVGSPIRRSGGIRAGSTNSPKALQNNGVAACGIPPSRLFKATHLPLTREALGAADRPISIYLTIVPAATPCVPLQRGRALIDGAENRPINIYLTVVPTGFRSFYLSRFQTVIVPLFMPLSFPFSYRFFFHIYGLHNYIMVNSFGKSRALFLLGTALRVLMGLALIYFSLA